MLLGCGKVEPLIDASIAHDAPKAIDAPPDTAPACQAPNMACGTSCIDPMTDNMHCGNCMTTCSTPTQSCFVGHCGYATSSCAVIHAFDPSAPDGPYTNMATNTQFFCDMTHGGVTYEELGFGEYDVAYPGFSEVATTDLRDPTIQQAFIWLYNHQSGGATTLSIGWVSNNCCFRGADTGAQELLINGGNVYPARVAAATFQCNGAYTDASYRFFIEMGAQYSPIPMPTTFFQTNTVTIGGTCVTGQNPAFFFKKHAN